MLFKNSCFAILVASTVLIVADCGGSSSGGSGGSSSGGAAGTGGSGGSAGSTGGTVGGGGGGMDGGPRGDAGPGELCKIDQECRQGLKCCYPCGIPDCMNACIEPLPGGRCPMFP